MYPFIKITYIFSTNYITIIVKLRQDSKISIFHPISYLIPKSTHDYTAYFKPEIKALSQIRINPNNLNRIIAICKWSAWNGGCVVRAGATFNIGCTLLIPVKTGTYPDVSLHF